LRVYREKAWGHTLHLLVLKKSNCLACFGRYL